MSNEAITWALAQPVGRSTAKFVLVAMANCAGDDMTCWPSIPYLVEATCQDRKTVMENMRRLREAGYITPTGEHKGRTKQVAVYRLSSTENGTVKATVPETVPVPKTDANSPVFPIEQSRFSVETGPKTVPGTLKEPKEEPKGKPKKEKATPPCVAIADLLANGFDPATAEEFIAHKSAVKAPLTTRAWADHLRESEKAGWTPQAAAEKVMAKNWKGFEAKYVEGEKAGGRGGGSRQEALEARNAAVLREMFDRAI